MNVIRDIFLRANNVKLYVLPMQILNVIVIRKVTLNFEN